MKQLTSMSVANLLSLRESIETELQRRQRQFEKDWAALANALGNSKGNGHSPLKGTKVKPKYRGPKGETWAGRGMQPKWLQALIKRGRKLESYRVKD